MHFVTLDDSDDDMNGEYDEVSETASSHHHLTTPRRSSASNNHMIHDQIRLGLLPRNAHPRSYSISAPETTQAQRRRSTCFIFCAGSVSTIAGMSMAVAIFLITMGFSDNGSGGGANVPSAIKGLAPQTTSPSDINVVWSCPVNESVDIYQLQMLPQTALPFVSNDTSQDVAMPDDGLSCATDVNGLNASTTYCFRIRAESETHGAGAWSSHQCNTTLLSTAPTAPNPPIVLDVTTNNTADSLHILTSLPTNQGGEVVHTMMLFVNSKYQGNVSVDPKTKLADTYLSLRKEERGQLVRLKTAACNDRGCSDLSNSLRCIVSKTEDGHADPIALCSACIVGGGGAGEDQTLWPPADITTRAGASDTSVLVQWEWDGSSKGEGKGENPYQTFECTAKQPSGFQLQRSDFWTQKDIENGPLVNFTVNGMREYLTEINRLLPAMTYTIRMRSYMIHSDGTLDFSAWSTDAVLRMDTAGACGNIKDVMVQRNKFAQLVSDIQTCMLECIISGETCVVNCVSRIGFTQPCATCWYEDGECVKKHCSGLCLKDPKGQECLQCTDEKCMPALEECTGLPRYTFPNPK